MKKSFYLTLLLLCFGWVCAADATVVRILTPLGLIDVKLYDDAAPQTVTNFLTYVNRGDYNNSFFHRSVPGFIIQGGGYQVDLNVGEVHAIETDSPVVNEYSPLRSNVRGTIAMAKVGNDPNSATSQWFLNLADNGANLDYQNGGFTVFGRIIGRGLEVADAVAGLTIVNAGSPFSDLPLLSPPQNGQIMLSQLVLCSSVAVLATETASSVDRVMNFLEQQFPEYVAPAGAETGLFDGYSFRYYSGTNSYVGIRDGHVYYLGTASQNEILDIGSLDEWYNQAVSAGY